MKWKSLRRWRCWVYSSVSQENNLRVLGLMSSPAEVQARAIESGQRGTHSPTHLDRLARAVTAETALVRVQILTHISARVPSTSYHESDSVRASGHLNIWFSRETRTAHVRHFILCLSNSRTMLVFTSFSLDPHVSLSVEDYWGNLTLVFRQRQHTTYFGRTLNFSKKVCIRRKFLGWTTESIF